MSALIVPERRILTAPIVIEGFGSPVFFAEGAIAKDKGETIAVVYFERRNAECIEVLRVHLPRSGFMLARAWIAEVFGAAVVH